MAELIAVSAVGTGWGQRFRYGLARIVGLSPCPLKAMSHGIVRLKPAWKDLTNRLKSDLGHILQIVSSHDAPEDIRSASLGREPCVLIRDDEGGVSMIADWNDIQVAAGDIAVFERIIRSKLLMY